MVAVAVLAFVAGAAVGVAAGFYFAYKVARGLLDYFLPLGEREPADAGNGAELTPVGDLKPQLVRQWLFGEATERVRTVG